MRKHVCVICYEELPRAQRTCGKSSCLDRWKHLSDDAKARHINLTTYTAAERTLILSQGPSEQELEARAERITQFEDDVATYNTQKQHDARPEFLRSMLAPDNIAPTAMPARTLAPNGHSISCTCEDCLKTIAPVIATPEKEVSPDGNSIPINAANLNPTDN